MPANRLSEMLAEVEAALQANRAEGEALQQVIAEGNRILRRKNLLFTLAFVGFAMDIILTGGLAVQGFLLHTTQQKSAAIQADLRSNTCNLNTLLAQSVTTSGNTVDLYKGLRPLLAANKDPDAQAAVSFIDTTTNNLATNQRIRIAFLDLTRATAENLACPAGFIPPAARK